MIILLTGLEACSLVTVMLVKVQQSRCGKYLVDVKPPETTK